jgi:hypothetical protein
MQAVVSGRTPHPLARLSILLSGLLRTTPQVGRTGTIPAAAYCRKREKTMAPDDPAPRPPRPKNTFDPLNIGGSRESSDWWNAADAANEFTGPVGVLGVGFAKLASLFRRKDTERRPLHPGEDASGSSSPEEAEDRPAE